MPFFKIFPRDIKPGTPPLTEEHNRLKMLNKKKIACTRHGLRDRLILFIQYAFLLQNQGF